MKIINYLGKHIQETFSMHSLSTTLMIPYATFHRVITRIGDLIEYRTIGHTKEIKINRRSQTAEAYLIISSEEEKKELLKKKPKIKIIHGDMKTKDIVLLFGSYAKGKEHKGSDIDLMIINKKGERSISFAKNELVLETEINPIFISEKEFIVMLKDDDENVGKQALKDHVVLNNPKRFWELVKNGI